MNRANYLIHRINRQIASTLPYKGQVVDLGCGTAPYCVLDLTERIHIEDEAIISVRCNLLTHQNIFRSPLAHKGYPPVEAPIVIKSGAVLFANVTVLMGVTIGECAMVAAGAVVTSDVPGWTLVGGIPAEPIKQLKVS